MLAKSYEEESIVALFVSLVVCAVGVAMVVWASSRSRATARGVQPAAIGSGRPTEMPCPTCERELVIARGELVELPGPEMALVVRSVKTAAGRKLGEFVCPHCSSAHCFIMDSGKLAYVGTNLYEPQAHDSTCHHCRRPLRKPVWAVGAYDGRLDEAPTVPLDYGLTCSQCTALSCVNCCRERSQVLQLDDGITACPRCSHAPVDTVYHG
jgi:hypothetical protein